MQKFLTILTVCAALIALTGCGDQADTSVSDTNNPNPLIVIGIESIRKSINKQAVPDSAFAFIRSARSTEVKRAVQQKTGAGQ